MDSTDGSSFDDDELLADLGTLGLAYKESNKNANIVKPKKQDKKSPAPSKQKRRPPKAMPINLDALLDGIDMNVPAAPGITPVTETPTSVRSSIPDRPISSIQQMELHISSYLSMQLRTISNEVLIFLENAFRENDKESEIIDAFIEDLKTSIRDIINFKNEEIISTPTANSLVEPFTPGFLEVFKDVQAFIDRKHFNGSNRLRSIRGLLATWPSVIKSTYNSAYMELVQTMADREMLRSRTPIDNSDAIQKHSQNLLTLFDLDCQQKFFIENEASMQRRIDNLEESRRRFYEDEEARDFGIEENDEDKILGEVTKLQKAISISGRNQINAFTSFDGAFDEAHSLWDLYHYNYEFLTAQIRNIRAMKYQQIDSSLSLPPPPPMPVLPPPLPFDVNTNDTDSFIEKVRRKMAKIQEESTKELDNVSDFLTSLKRKEKRRRRNPSFHEDSFY